MFSNLRLILKIAIYCNLNLLLTYFIATPPYRGWQRSEGLLLLHS